jgi:hypothetical protein
VARDRTKPKSSKRAASAATSETRQASFDTARAMTRAWHNRLRGRDLPDSSELLRDDRQR